MHSDWPYTHMVKMGSRILGYLFSFLKVYREDLKKETPLLPNKDSSTSYRIVRFTKVHWTKFFLKLKLNHFYWLNFLQHIHTHSVLNYTGFKEFTLLGISLSIHIRKCFAIKKQSQKRKKPQNKRVINLTAQKW